MKKLIENDCLDDVRLVYENRGCRSFLVKKFAVEPAKESAGAAAGHIYC